MLWLLASLVAPAQAEEMEVVVDGSVSHVTVTCDRDVFERDVTSVRPGGTQTLTFPIYPGRQCSIEVTKRIGEFEQIGAWRCTDSGCVQTSTGDDGPSITAGAGEIAILIAADLPHTQLELSCPSGYRERVDIAEFRATFTGVPDEACTVLFKGGPPMKANDLRAGTAYRCHVVSNNPVCLAQ